jgi:hypothetical protein
VQAAAAAEAEAAAATTSALRTALEGKAKDLEVQTQRTMEQTQERKQVRGALSAVCCASPGGQRVWSDPLCSSAPRLTSSFHMSTTERCTG